MWGGGRGCSHWVVVEGNEKGAGLDAVLQSNGQSCHPLERERERGRGRRRGREGEGEGERERGREGERERKRERGREDAGYE